MTTAPRMEVLRTPDAVRRQVRMWRQRGRRVAFVPTMGFFHDGHLSLMRRARRHADRVVVSLFVNPTQFEPGEDLARYPRNVPRDLDLARANQVDLCFVPRSERMYAPEHRTEVHVTGAEHVLEGAARPTHFAGVALVVLKLLHIVEPDVLVLGQKDAQQAIVLETMIRDLDLPVKVVRGPIVRERDGLAMSSRNVYLKGDERRAASILWRSLHRARALIREGERRAAPVLRAMEGEIAQEPGVRLEYVAVVDGRTLAPLDRLEGRVLIPLAAYVGTTRLIDNLELTVRPVS